LGLWVSPVARSSGGGSARARRGTAWYSREELGP